MRAWLALLPLLACEADKATPDPSGAQDSDSAAPPDTSDSGDSVPTEDTFDTEDTEDSDPPPTWDAEAAPIDCADGDTATLLETALADADLAPGELVYTTADWAEASYRRQLDDDFRLSWFRDVHDAPLSTPCVGGQMAADLDGAAASAHPVATALGEVMVRLDITPTADPPDPDAASQDTVDLSSLPEELALALVPILAELDNVAAVRAALDETAPSSTRNLVLYGHGGIMLETRSTLDLSDDDVQDWVLDPAGPSTFYEPARALAWAVEEADLGRFAGTDATLDVETALGRVIVAGPEADEPGELEDVAFYLDLGGDDVYVHPAGASTEGAPVSVHIDLGGADDYGYVQEDAGSEGILPADEGGRYGGDDYYGTISFSRVCRQGAGCYGVGLLFDLGGDNDHYQSLRMSQGWAHLGVGVLYDDGGDDTYLGEDGVQGAASMGIGLLMDAGGDDVHETFANSQGFGYVRGAGVAWDGGGNDSWYADPGRAADGGTPMYYSPQMPGDGNSSFVQGIGFGYRGDSVSTWLSGGIGVLRDLGGDDAYQASTFAQGSGYWQGTGLLLDGGGQDSYDAYYYVQGGAAHYAIGALLDDGDEGDFVDTLVTPAYMHFGAGHDYSVGIFVNEGGDDTYVYSGLAAGASNCQGIGLFVDNDGADTYTASSDYSTGLGNHSSECEARSAARSMGIFVDSGGDADSYTFPTGSAHPTPADDSSFGYSWNGTSDEHGGAVDGDGATAVHADGVGP